MVVRLTMVAALSFLSACQETPPAARPATVESYRSPAGIVYTIERAPGLQASKLPQNNDLKMADYDLLRFAVTPCSLDNWTKYAIKRCDIYVQSDKTGTLIGYAFLILHSNGVQLTTVTNTNEKYERGCGIDGQIYSSETGQIINDLSRNFAGQIMYSAWEKDPGDFLVSQVGPNDKSDTAPDSLLGVWYISQRGNKLRITQERWNYCYRDNSISVDDVFYKAASVRNASNSRT